MGLGPGTERRLDEERRLPGEKNQGSWGPRGEPTSHEWQLWDWGGMPLGDWPNRAVGLFSSLLRWEE